jgi:NAD(P)-dependent dehydrogenase (short-subunit alcohol dehydrogenase family)
MQQEIFTEESTSDDVLENLDLTGKTYAITGATGGLGLETARAIGMKGGELLLIARNADKLDAASTYLNNEGINKVTCYVIDLSDLQSIHQGVKAILDTHEKIDCLINNAGIMACPLERTKQGFEAQFGTNHLGHFLLTTSLLTALKNAKNARVITLSSAGPKIAPVNFEDPNYETRDYEKWQAYGESKTANALFSVGFDERYAQEGIRAFSVHPGMIATDLARHLTNDDIEDLAKTGADMGSFKTIPQGAATSVWAACHPALADKGGIYLEDCQIAVAAKENVNGGFMPYAADKALAEKLWLLSEEMIKEYR